MTCDRSMTRRLARLCTTLRFLPMALEGALDGTVALSVDKHMIPFTHYVIGFDYHAAPGRRSPSPALAGPDRDPGADGLAASGSPAAQHVAARPHRHAARHRTHARRHAVRPLAARPLADSHGRLRHPAGTPDAGRSAA